MSSMSTHIKGFKPADEKWKAMKAVWDACRAAQIKVPEEVEKFFESTIPDSRGIEINLENHPSVTNFLTNEKSGFEVEKEKRPSWGKIVPHKVSIERAKNIALKELERSGDLQAGYYISKYVLILQGIFIVYIKINNKRIGEFHINVCEEKIIGRSWYM